VPSSCTQDLNNFKHESCYNFWVTTELDRYGGSLRALFDAYAASGDDGSAAGGSHATVMSFAEWLDMNRDFGLIDGDFTAREATLAFVWSRMRVINELKEATRKKVESLSFEDFLEAIVRTATMKEMPLDEEISAEGVDCPGLWLLKLRSEGRYETFSRTHSREWNDPPRQNLEKCVDKLVRMMLRIVEDSSQGADDLNVTHHEAKQFVLRH